MLDSTHVPEQIGQYRIKEFLGKGAYGVVYRANHNITKQDVSIKIISKKSIYGDHARLRFTREVHFLQKMDHPFISKFFQLMEDQDNQYIVLEYLSGGTIKSAIKNLNGKPIQEGLVRRYFMQILLALEYLHNEMHIIHRDLKAENVMLDKYNNIRLIDFGLCCEIKGILNENSACGSLSYIPPEMIKEQKYNDSVDVWSLGILLYAMTTGSLPFFATDTQSILQKIVYSDPIIPRNISTNLSDLLKKMLTKEPRNRITLDAIKAHPWVSDFEFNKMNNFISNYKINDKIDSSIIKSMDKLGVDTSGIKLNCLGFSSNDTIATYMIMKNEKNVNELRVGLMNNYRKIFSMETFKQPIKEKVHKSKSTPFSTLEQNSFYNQYSSSSSYSYFEYKNEEVGF